MLSISWSCVTVRDMIDLSISYDIQVDGDEQIVVLSDKIRR